jgi:hypothetical protein
MASTQNNILYQFKHLIVSSIYILSCYSVSLANQMTRTRPKIRNYANSTHLSNATKQGRFNCAKTFIPYSHYTNVSFGNPRVNCPNSFNMVWFKKR